MNEAEAELEPDRRAADEGCLGTTRMETKPNGSIRGGVRERENRDERDLNLPPDERRADNINDTRHDHCNSHQPSKRENRGEKRHEM